MRQAAPRDRRTWTRRARPSAQEPPARTRCPASRSPATPTPASPRCSTGSPAPACWSRTRCSPPSTRPSAGRRRRDGRDYTLTDTVGFVRHLPHQLVEAFRSTLEEVADADLILHVVDGSRPRPGGPARRRPRGARARSAPRTCPRSSWSTRPTSADPMVARAAAAARAALASWSRRAPAQGIDELLEPRSSATCRTPRSRSTCWCRTPRDLVARVHDDGEVLSEEHTADGTSAARPGRPPPRSGSSRRYARRHRSPAHPRSRQASSGGPGRPIFSHGPPAVLALCASRASSPGSPCCRRARREARDPGCPGSFWPGQPAWTHLVALSGRGLRRPSPTSRRPRSRRARPRRPHRRRTAPRLRRPPVRRRAAAPASRTHPAGPPRSRRAVDVAVAASGFAHRLLAGQVTPGAALTTTFDQPGRRRSPSSRPSARSSSQHGRDHVVARARRPRRLAYLALLGLCAGIVLPMVGYQLDPARRRPRRPRRDPRGTAGLPRVRPDRRQRLASTCQPSTPKAARRDPGRRRRRGPAAAPRPGGRRRHAAAPRTTSRWPTVEARPRRGPAARAARRRGPEPAGVAEVVRNLEAGSPSAPWTSAPASAGSARSSRTPPTSSPSSTATA